MAELDEIRAICAENRWVFFERHSAPQIAMAPDQVGRLLRDVGRKNVMRICDFLHLYASARNADQTDSIEQPMVDAQPLSGAWRMGALHAVEDDRGRINIIQILSASDGAGGRAMATEKTCMFTATTTYYWEVGYIEEIPAAASGITYALQGLSRNSEKGTFSYVIERRSRIYVAIASHVSESAPSGATATTKHFGVRDGDLDENGAAVPLLDMTATPGHIKRRSRTKNGDCTQDIVDEDQAPADQTSVSEEHSAAADTVATLHTEGATIADKSAGDGTIRDVQETPTPAGNVRTLDRVTTPIDQTSVSEEHSAAEDVVITRHTEGATIADKSAADGTYREVSELPTAAGNLQTADRVATPKDQTGSGYEKSSDASPVGDGVAAATGESDSARTTHTLGDELSTPTISSPGTVQSGASVPTRIAGKFATTATTETGKYQFASGTTVTSRGTDKWAWGRNATWAQYEAAAAAFTFDSTTDSSNTYRINRFGLIDYDIIQRATSGVLRTWPQSDNTDFLDKWVEYDHLYSVTYGRVRRYKRTNTQTFHLSVRLTWLDAIGVTGIDAHVTRRAKVENHGAGFIAFIPLQAIQYGDWELDETGVT